MDRAPHVTRPASAAAGVLLTATTFPRWQGDARPVFILELARGLVRRGIEVHLLAPHAAGARTAEVVDGILSRMKAA